MDEFTTGLRPVYDTRLGEQNDLFLLVYLDIPSDDNDAAIEHDEFARPIFERLSNTPVNVSETLPFFPFGGHDVRADVFILRKIAKRSSWGISGKDAPLRVAIFRRRDVPDHIVLE
jgi:hypothetical protein